MGARYYDPKLARFISADTIVPKPFYPISLNRYAYAYNNPIILKDLDGHDPNNYWSSYYWDNSYYYSNNNYYNYTYSYSSYQNSSYSSYSFSSNSYSNYSYNNYSYAYNYSSSSYNSYWDNSSWNSSYGSSYVDSGYVTYTAFNKLERSDIEIMGPISIEKSTKTGIESGNPNAKIGITHTVGSGDSISFKSQNGGSIGINYYDTSKLPGFSIGVPDTNISVRPSPLSITYSKIGRSETQPSMLIQESTTVSLEPFFDTARQVFSASNTYLLNKPLPFWLDMLRTSAP